MHGKRFFSSFWGAFFSLFLICPSVFAGTKQVDVTVPFPNLTFSQSLSKGEQEYLGLSNKKVFSFQEIKGSLILVEVLSTYCANCLVQAPLFSELNSLIEKDPALKGKVKMIGIAAGNNLMEIEYFKKTYGIPYPILSDVKFDAHTALGSPRTPFSIWVRRDSQGKGIVVRTHLGLIKSVETAFAETQSILQYDLALLKRGEGAVYGGDALKPPLTEEELSILARKGMEASGGKVSKIEKITFKDGDWLYAGEVDRGARKVRLFSKLASRRAICDLCHDTFFLYTFDATGKVVDIVPIQLTKADNLAWTDQDLKRLKSRTVGKSILKPFPFNPQADSISGATGTAVLIFDTLDKAKGVFEKLKKEGHVK